MASRPMHIMSICAGIGGIDCGIGLAVRSRTICFIERESCAAATLVVRMAEEALGQAPIWDNLSAFDGRPWRGVVDCIAAGLPCQPYSLAGKRAGDDDERAIWPGFMRVVGEVRPALVFLENVPAFVTGGHFRGAGEELCRLGYEIKDPLFLRASDVGAPHRRERVFIMAYRKGLQRRLQLQSRGPHQAGPQHRRGSQTVANARDGQLQESRRCPETRNGTGSGSTKLGHTWGPRPLRRPERREGQGCATRQTRPGGTRRPAERNGQPMAFPPGPADTDAWAVVLKDYSELAPAVEPSFQRVADGSSSRMDQLRLAGNGVVPLMVAVAFRTLLDADG